MKLLIYNVWSNDKESLFNISTILKYSPNIGLYNNEGYTALMMAVRYSNYTAAEMLLEAGADVKTKTPIGDVFKIAEGNNRFTSLLDKYDYDEDYNGQ
jgi:ankyrin repeat protein